MTKSSSESDGLTDGLTEAQIRVVNSLDSVNAPETKRPASSGAGWSILSIVSACGGIAAKLFHDRLAVVLAIDAADRNSASLVVRDYHTMLRTATNLMMWTATILTIAAILAAVFACRIDKSPLRRTTAVVLSLASFLCWFIFV